MPEKSELYLDARVQAAYLYDRKDQTQKAIEVLQPALKKRNDRKELHAFLSSLYRKNKDYPKAILAMEQCGDARSRKAMRPIFNWARSTTSPRTRKSPSRT